MTDKCENFNCPYRTDSGYCSFTACINHNKVEVIPVGEDLYTKGEWNPMA